MSDQKLLIDDLVVLGNAVPDVISDYRITVCIAGFSETYGFVRIYPVPPASPMRRWNVVQVPLERNPKDTRAESWKIEGSKAEWSKIASKIQVNDVVQNADRRQYIEDLYKRYGVGCVDELNDQKVSLGMVKPQILGFELKEREDYEPTAQSQLNQEKPFLTIKNYRLKPVLKYRCPNCQTKNPHEQQIVEWGVFEWMRQHPTEPEKVWENLRMTDSSYERTLFVGNMALHRNSFMVISILRFKSE